ncbi:MAG TPA: hypothetical protein PLV45_03740, partial [bacterium]|nr:hypothetical protein [bacterium]
TQNTFWAVNMGKMTHYDPIHETEYLIRLDLKHAERLGILRHLVSTYDPHSDRISIGYDGPGPKILSFAPLLDLEIIPLNQCIRTVLQRCEEAVGQKVEIEFAVTFDPALKHPARFGILQARPMVVSDAVVDVDLPEMTGSRVLVASENVMGNGIMDTLSDIIYVKPEAFDPGLTREVARELDGLNRQLVKDGNRYILIGFGRWGSSDPWLGIPVNWGQISGARVLVEATLPNMIVDLSQGSHFFHNLSSFQVGYFAVRHHGPYRIDWEWLNCQDIVQDNTLTRHVRTRVPLMVKMDGRHSRGLITYDK